jgi:hypothetical protein
MTATINDPEKLSLEQQNIIVAAMEDSGRFQIATRSDTGGKAVRTKHEKFFDPDDRSFARRHIEAARELERLLFIREEDGRDKFELTNFGWLIGRKLKQDRKAATQGNASGSV